MVHFSLDTIETEKLLFRKANAILPQEVDTASGALITLRERCSTDIITEAVN